MNHGNPTHAPKNTHLLQTEQQRQPSAICPSKEKMRALLSLTFLVAGPALQHSVVRGVWELVWGKGSNFSILLAVLRKVFWASVVQVRPQSMQGELVPAVTTKVSINVQSQSVTGPCAQNILNFTARGCARTHLAASCILCGRTLRPIACKGIASALLVSGSHHEG